MDWIVENWAAIGTASLAVAGAVVAITKITKNTTDDDWAAKLTAAVKKVFGR
ncbi:MAG: hypothetical protein KKE29_19970 [Proteobacteria bacterium]|nr:hypothetical protein [Pseudomonadota bacterium]MBV1715967.1 hypothetical protein [Desulfarculus sp.]